MNVRPVSLLVVLLLVSSCVEVKEGPTPSAMDWAAFASPPAGFGPWARWWWPGGDVEDGELAREVAAMTAAGFSGAEIQAFAAALDPEASEEELARRFSWGSDAFYGHLGAALDAAADTGLEISMTAGSGWSTGDDHLSPEDSMQTLLISEYPVTGPGAATINLDGPDLAPFYQIAESAEAMGEPLARYMGDDARLVSVLAAREVAGERDPNPLVLTDQILLDPETVVLLTDQVSAGTLKWDVPDGSWSVVAFWAAPDGEYVSLPAYPEEAWVMDHLSPEIVTSTLDRLIGPVAGHPALAGLFADSFELKAERLWVDDFMEEFQTRRGYDPEPWLPAVMVPGADNHIFDGAGIPRVSPFGFGADDARVRYDWQRTVSELFIEGFVETATAWGAARGLRFRIQPYGLGIDVIAAAAAAHVPEAEQLYAGGSELLLKAVAAGGHLGGRPVISAESMVWAGKDHMLTPTKLKASADKLFSAGVNRVLFHGFPYRIEEGYGDQGWHPFSSPWSGSGTYGSNLGEGSPWWDVMPEISRYLARVQWALRQGSPETDVAVYLPFIGMSAALGRMDDWNEALYQGAFPDEPGGDRDALFDLVDAILGPADPGPAVEWLVAVKPRLDALDAAGLTWEWVNDEALAGAAARDDGTVALGETSYRAVLLIDAPWIQAEAAEALAAAAADGVPVVVEGEAPVRVPGLDIGGLDARVATAGLSGGALPVAAFPAGPGIRSIRRRLDDGGVILFFRNPAGTTATLDIPLEGCLDATLLDPWAGTFRDVAQGPFDEVLAPYGSRILTCALGAPSLEDGWADVTGRDLSAREELTAWQLTVTGPDVAEGAVVMDAADLPDWRDVDALRYCSTPGTYTTTLAVPDGFEGPVVLRLGAVSGGAAVAVNGQDAGAALVPPYEVDVTGLLVVGDNEIEVRVTPPLRNRLVGLGLAGEPEYPQYNKEETLVPVGLRGPVEVFY